jgi:hypothetical protein
MPVFTVSENLIEEKEVGKQILIFLRKTLNNAYENLQHLPGGQIQIHGCLKKESHQILCKSREKCDGDLGKD